MLAQHWFARLHLDLFNCVHHHPHNCILKLYMVPFSSLFAPSTFVLVLSIKFKDRGPIRDQIGKTQDGIPQLGTWTYFFPLVGYPPLAYAIVPNLNMVSRVGRVKGLQKLQIDQGNIMHICLGVVKK
jgi:hypothetical protein